MGYVLSDLQNYKVGHSFSNTLSNCVYVTGPEQVWKHRQLQEEVAYGSMVCSPNVQWPDLESPIID